LWEDRKFPVLQDTLNPRIFYVQNEWPYKQEYRIKVDSAAIFSIYGKWNDSINNKFLFKGEEDYGDLYVEITGNETAGFGELLDGSEKVVRKSFLLEGELAFEDLPPGKYYLRFIEDANENGKWDTGNYAEKRQPEKVYYFNREFEIRKFREDTYNWDIGEVPIGKQKPLEITKNKPVVKQPRRDNQNNRNNKQQNTNRPNSGSPNPQGTGNRSIQQRESLTR
jgi:hypothetical protein